MLNLRAILENTTDLDEFEKTLGVINLEVLASFSPAMLMQLSIIELFFTEYIAGMDSQNIDEESLAAYKSVMEILSRTTLIIDSIEHYMRQATQEINERGGANDG